MNASLDRKISFRIYIGLVICLALLAGVNVLLPQGSTGMIALASPPPAPLPLLALANAGIILVVYGSLGLVGLLLARRLGLPEIWDRAIADRSRFLLPALSGAATAIVLVGADILLAPVNGFGRFPHPPFPTSIVASITAAIGEELIFRLFFISFWTWLISRLILRGRGQGAVYWIVAVASAVAFGLGHLPALMFLQGWTTLAQIPPVLLGEVLALNGLLAIVAAFTFKRVGFLGPVGVHLWNDIIWHVLWGATSM
jgi:membrane protease YdiL (CAAX protease family)